MNSTSDSYRILVLDDNEAQLETIQGILENENYIVYAFSQYKDAFNFLKDNEIDVAIFDLRMPGISELDLINQIQNISESIPVIINTAYGSFDTAKKAINIGTFAYLEKAGDPQLLINEVSRAIHNRLEKEKMKLEDAVKIRTLELEKEITKRKKSEIALKESEKKYRLIANNSMDVIWVIDLTTKQFLYISPSIKKLRGFTIKEAMAEDFINSIVEEMRDEIEVSIKKRILEFKKNIKKSFKDEVQQYKKDGSKIWVELSSITLINPDNGHIEVHGSTRNIEKRKQAETKLLDSINELSAIYESIPISVLLIDNNFKIKKSNTNFKHLISKTEDKISNKRWGDIFNCIHHLNYATSCGLTPNCKNCKINNSIISTLKNKKGIQETDVWIEVYNNKIQSKYCFTISTSYLKLNNEEYVLLSANNITDRKNSEQNLKASEELFRTFMNTTEDIIFIKDAKLNYIFSNTANSALLGKNNKDIIGENNFKLMPKKMAKACNITDLACLKDNTLIINEEKAFDKIYESSKFPVALSDNSIGVGGIVRDITERENSLNIIKESERKLNTLISNLPGMAYRCKFDRKWTMLYISEGSKKLSGYNNYEFINNAVLSFNEIIHPNDRDRVWTKWQECVLNKEAFQEEYQIITKDDKIKWVLEKGIAIYDNKGKVIALEGFISDITDSKLAKIIITQSEEKFRALADNSIDIIWQMDMKLKYIYLSPSLYKITGFKASDWLGTNFFAHIKRNDFIWIARLIINLLKDKSILPFIRIETELINKKNNFIPVELIIKPLHNNKMQIVGLQGSTRDIRNRIEASKAIERSELRYQKLVETSQDGIALLNLNNEFFFLNNRMANMLGYHDYHDLKGKNAPDLMFKKRDAKLIKEKRKELFSKGKLSNFEIFVHQKDTSSFPAEFNVSVIPDDEGNPELFMIMMHDISYRIDAERALKRQNIIETSLADVSRLILKPNTDIQEISSTIIENLHKISHSGNSLITYNSELLAFDKLDTKTKSAESICYISGESSVSFSQPNDRMEFFLKNRFNKYDKCIYYNNPSEFEELLSLLDKKHFHIRNILICPIQIADLNLGTIILTNKDTDFIKEDLIITTRFAEMYGYYLYKEIIQKNFTNSQERFQQLANHVDSIFFILSPDLLELIYISKAVENILEISVEKMIKKPFKWLKNIKKEDIKFVLQNFNNIKKNKSDFSKEFDYRFITDSEDKKWIRTQLFPVYNKLGKIVRIAGISNDITENKLVIRKEMNALIKGEENERIRLSQELHDGLGPLMTTLRLYMQAMERSKDSNKIIEIANKSEKIFYEAVKTLTEISNNLSPHVLRNYGVAEALKYFIEKIRQIHNIDIEYNCNCDDRNNDLIETTIYRVVCELINNTIKHSNASKIILSIFKDKNILHIQFSDNGKGFNLEKILNSNKGMGLINIQNRIKNINGEIIYKSKIRKGFSATISILFDKLG